MQVIKPSSYTVQLIHKEFSPNNQCALLTYQCESDFTFYDGQFVQIQCIIDNHIYKRSFSLASSSIRMLQTHQFSLLIKRVPDGLVSNWLLDEHQIGEWITMIWPLGHLTQQLLPLICTSYCLIWTWSGIAPLIWLAHGMEHAQTPHTLIVWERHYDSLIPSIVDVITMSWSYWSWYIALSQDIISWPWYATWHIQDILKPWLLEQHNLHTIWFFICGKPTMCQEVIDLLIHHGVPRNHIKDERY